MEKSQGLNVRLLPDTVDSEKLVDGGAIVIDVLRATTTIVHAFAAGAPSVCPCRLQSASCMASFPRAVFILM